MAFLVTGGAGYLGSHIVKQLIEHYGENVVVLDNFSNGNRAKLARSVQIIDADITSPNLHNFFDTSSKFEGVFHIAAKKSVTQSVLNPDLYREVNIEGTRNITELCKFLNIPRIVFASTAAVYGAGNEFGKIDETLDTSPANPYGETKLYGEKLITALGLETGTTHTSLRIFNLAGTADPLLFDFGGENVISILLDKFTNDKQFNIFGHQLGTPDGSCVRDYVHVSDVATACISAMKSTKEELPRVINLSSGIGKSVLELIASLESITGKTLDTTKCEIREGESESVIGDNTIAKEFLDWNPKKNIEMMLEDSWNAWSIHSNRAN